jgi:8-oxo-dGTP pyrophosphatase MutT (NUDIX family)
MSDWDDRIAAFWAAADDARPEQTRRALELLLSERDAADAAALFERAGLHDFFGDERAAIPLYRAALRAGLDARRRSQAVIQLASSLRNIGDAGGALRELETLSADDSLGGAAAAFRALALHDARRSGEALRVALAALAPTLPRYERAVASYAQEIPDDPSPERIRAIAVALVVRDDHVLAEIYTANERHEAFARLPGGGIDFGESAQDAVRREVREELGLTAGRVRLRAVSENIFDRGGRRGHEVVHVFDVGGPDFQTLPLDAELPVLDSHTTVRWISLDAVRAGELPLYPDGALALAEVVAAES